MTFAPMESYLRMRTSRRWSFAAIGLSIGLALGLALGIAVGLDVARASVPTVARADRCPCEHHIEEPSR
jgi:predicted ABC-type sugar transport system permease subunit